MKLIKEKPNEKIMEWIEDYQEGKSGIYPYRVAEQVCLEFKIDIAEAFIYVNEHIRKVSQESLE